MIAIRVHAQAPTFVVGGERYLQPGHPLWDVDCPVCDMPLGGGAVTLVYVGVEPSDRKPAGWTTGAAVCVHVACAGPGAQREGDGHMYLSTACWHEAQDGNPEMHASCRATCKWCDQSCACPNHPANDMGEPPPHWVDQARDIARQLLDALPVGAIPLHLAERVESDPALFWLRGEERPSGTWTAGEATDGA